MALVSRSDLDGGIINVLVWDALRMHSKQQHSPWEIHEYIDLLNAVCLNASIACSFVMFEHIAQYYVDLNFIC